MGPHGPADDWAAPLERGIEILRVVSACPRRDCAAIAAAIGASEADIHGLLPSLVEHGFLVRTACGYAVGETLLLCAARAVERPQVAA